MVAAGGASDGSGGSQNSNARWYASFASAKRSDDVQRERELEQHQRHRLPLAAALQQRQQLAVVADRLVERVLLTRAVAGARQVVDRLVLVVGGQPVVGEHAERPLRGSPAYCLSSHSAASPVQAVDPRSDSSVR